MSNPRHDRFRIALLAALGVGPLVACGGSTTDLNSKGDRGGSSSTGGGGGSATGGTTPSDGGESALGGKGGSTATGGRDGSSGAVVFRGGSTGKGGTVGNGGRNGLGGATPAGGSSGMSSGGAGGGWISKGGSGGAATRGGADSGGQGGEATCKNPKPPSGDPNGGYVECDGGWLHRPKVVACTSKLPRPDAIGGAGGVGTCSSDAECTAKAHGHCAPPEGGSIPGNRCQYGCTQDSECAPGSVCLCGDPIGKCVSAKCSVDADCPGGLCASYVAMPGCDRPAFACLSPDDQCISNADCPEPQRCTLNTQSFRVCQAPTCAAGRPFLIDGVSRTASRTDRDDWLGSCAEPLVSGLSASTRERLAQAWSEAALMEHASIAAFARFTLELLAFGAPADLVARASRAMAEETRHAEQAFRLASAYAGHAIGPSSLAFEGSLTAADLESCAVTTLLEGCIGETLAALEASAALETATDPAVRDVLARVVEEESEHAELAYRFLKWALARSGGPLARRLESTFQAAMSEAASEPHLRLDPETEAQLASHGILSNARRAALRREVLRDVVAPCVEALLATSAALFAPESASA